MNFRQEGEILVLTIGFFGLSLAILIAHLSPAKGYELSIYGATPISSWIGIVLGLGIALVVSFNSRIDRYRYLGVSLGSLSILTICALRTIRGYYHLGTGDSLHHIARTKDLYMGLTGVRDTVYPGTHLIAMAIRDISGITIPHSFQLVVLIFVVVYLVFVPLSIRTFINTPHAVLIATFSGSLLLPINYIIIIMNFHPISQTILFSAFILSLFSMNMHKETKEFHTLLIISLAVIVILHPQQALNLLVVFGAASVVYLVIKTLGTASPIGRSIYAQTVTLGIVFWAWFQSTRFEGSLVRFIIALFENTGIATATQSRSLSLEALGSSPEEMFFKLFFSSLIFCLLAGILMLLYLRKIPQNEQEYFLIALTYGFVPVTGMFFIYIIADKSTQYFRHLGFMMVIVTIVGSFSIYRFVSYLSIKWDESTINIAVTIFFALLLITSIPLYNPSPYIFQDSDHVPEAHTNGFETAFTYSDHTRFIHIRSRSVRFADAIFGGTAKERDYYHPEGPDAPDHFADQDLASYYNQSAYLAVTSADRILDPVLYNGFRFSHEDMAYLERDRNISRVQSNGHFDLYLVENKRASTRENSPS